MRCLLHAPIPSAIPSSLDQMEIIRVDLGKSFWRINELWPRGRKRNGAQSFRTAWGGGSHCRSVSTEPWLNACMVLRRSARRRQGSRDRLAGREPRLSSCQSPSRRLPLWGKVLRCQGMGPRLRPGRCRILRVTEIGQMAKRCRTEEEAWG